MGAARLALLLGALLAVAGSARAQELNAVYATQTAFETSSPIIYTTNGICIENAVKVHNTVQVFLPPLSDVLLWELQYLARNLAYVIDLPEGRKGFATQGDSITVDMTVVGEAELRRGVSYNVTVADVSAGIQFNIASASCTFKLGYA